VDLNRVRYTIVSHTGSPQQVGLSLVLDRISGSDRCGVVAVHNPTNGTMNYQVRWARENGEWTPWEDHSLAAGNLMTLRCRGGFHCEIRYDASFEEGEQTALHALAITARNREGDTPQPRRYRFELDGVNISLVPQP
jgi:hypothetical protein